ncbi:nitrate/nitrite transporter [Austwickia sp. TVS 96-490-7B]|uniref:MFS transporter n=1 Tax=Austwickia sp. TVS 96-490-7B TaxID=2830843 RepID=UPI00351D6643
MSAPFAIDMFGAKGSWRLIPLIYTALLILLGILTWIFVPRQDRTPGQAKPLADMLEPLKEMRVWRFSLYYVVVFGAYVALSSVLPTYYSDAYGVPLTAQALLTASYIFPASLLRPVGGWASDRWGARRVMYLTFGLMLVLCGILIVPGLPLALFATVVFLVGCAMGIGKAAVYKHIPEYYPTNVGSVGGLVGMLGGLGGFFLPPLFYYVKAATGMQTATFLVLFLITLISAIWMHLTIVRMKRQGIDTHEHAIDHSHIHRDPQEA